MRKGIFLKLLSFMIVLVLLCLPVLAKPRIQLLDNMMEDMVAKTTDGIIGRHIEITGNYEGSVMAIKGSPVEVELLDKNSRYFDVYEIPNDRLSFINDRLTPQIPIITDTYEEDGIFVKIKATLKKHDLVRYDVYISPIGQK